MYTTTGERLTWAQFEERRNAGEQLFVGEYPESDRRAFKEYAHSHTKEETEKWLVEQDASLDIMYKNGRPVCYDKWNGECAGIRCKDGYLWN